MSKEEMAQLAHLMRRAGFGASREELERYAAKGYEATVEELLQLENAPQYEDDDVSWRYHVDESSLQDVRGGQTYWIRRMINSPRPLEEKMALFWHGVFATGDQKLSQTKIMTNQIDMFRKYGLGDFRTLLIQLSRDPGMIMWLDNKDNHGDAVNENFGRELLELFAVGVGMDGQPNYTEQDVRQCSRAFTGWTILNDSYHAVRSAQDSSWPYGKLDWQFEYRPHDHDDGEKTFLGHTGRFKGEDIIDIICQQPATARFISRHLYNFFVADEPQVPAWQNVPARDSEAIKALENAYFQSQYDIRSVLRALFNSDFFKKATFAKVKSPTEIVVGTVRLTGGYEFPSLGDIRLAEEADLMGQKLLQPPSVEGWHTGTEWLNTGSLVRRINFAAEEFGGADKPGLRDMVRRIKSSGATQSTEGVLDSCLELLGFITLSENSKTQIIGQVKTQGEFRFGTETEERLAGQRIQQMLALIAATKEYQLA